MNLQLCRLDTAVFVHVSSKQTLPQAEAYSIHETIPALPETLCSLDPEHKSLTLVFHTTAFFLLTPNFGKASSPPAAS
jgi:hypothetical protein